MKHMCLLQEGRSVLQAGVLKQCSQKTSFNKFLSVFKCVCAVQRVSTKMTLYRKYKQSVYPFTEFPRANNHVVGMLRFMSKT